MSLTTEQSARRVSGVGASECAAVLGVSRYATPLDIYAKKVNPQNYYSQEADHLRWGHLLEPVILDAYESTQGVRLSRSPDTVICQDHHYMFAHLDAQVVGPFNHPLVGRVVEAKSSGVYAPKEWGPSGTDNVPMEYLIQVHHQMICMGQGVGSVGDIAVLIGGNDFRIYSIPFDKALATQIVGGVSKFWSSVLARNPPKPQTVDDLNKLFIVSNGKEIKATPEIGLTVRDWKGNVAIRNQLDETIEKQEFTIKEFMQDNDALVVDGRVVATWKQYDGALRFDQKAFSLEHPEMYRQYSKQGRPVRRFVSSKEKK